MEMTLKEELERLLVETPLEEFTPYIYDVLSTAASGDTFEQWLSGKYEDIRKSTQQFATEVLAALQGGSVKIGDTVITDATAIDCLRDALVEQYRNKRLNYRPLTYEEAQALLQDWRADDMVKEWVHDSVVCCYADEDLLVPWMDICVRQAPLIDLFAMTHEVEEDVTLEQVQRVIKDSVTTKQAMMAGPQNLREKWALGKIERVYQGHAESDLILYYDCLNLFGLIDRGLKKNREALLVKENPKKIHYFNQVKTGYIRMVYRWYKSDYSIISLVNLGQQEGGE